jgi:hypothetical protein
MGEATMTSDNIAKSLGTVTAEIEKLQEESGLASYLRWQARFYSYSPSNALLIQVQRPDATEVPGYHPWLELGRHARKGEKGIITLNPILRSRGNIRRESSRLYKHEGFKAKMGALFLSQLTGRLPIPKIIDALERIAHLEPRLEVVEQALAEFRSGASDE